MRWRRKRSPQAPGATFLKEAWPEALLHSPPVKERSSSDKGRGLNRGGGAVLSRCVPLAQHKGWAASDCMGGAELILWKWCVGLIPNT